MKEATGELNMTVFVVLIVGVLLSFFYTVIWPIVKQSMITTTQCKNAICTNVRNSDGTVDCKYYETDDPNETGVNITCVWKG